MRLDNARRRDAGLTEFDETLDVFHTLREGGRALKKTWSVATHALERAEAAQKTVQPSKSCPDWPEHAGRVRAVLRGVWRASSLVECLNSVARMQQARHRKMTQGLLDLKRLYWNLRRFRTGCRKGQTPYSLLGVSLPDLSFGEFLRLTPVELRNPLSGQSVGS